MVNPSKQQKIYPSDDIRCILETPTELSDTLKEFEKIIENHVVAFDKYIQKKKGKTITS